VLKRLRHLVKGNESVRSLEEAKITKANRSVEVEIVLCCCLLSEGEGAHKQGKIQGKEKYPRKRHDKKPRFPTEREQSKHKGEGKSIVEKLSTLVCPTSVYVGCAGAYGCGHSQHGLLKIINEQKMIGNEGFTQLGRVAEVETKSLYRGG